MSAASFALRWASSASNLLRGRHRDAAELEQAESSRQERRLSTRLRVNFEASLFGPGGTVLARGLDIHHEGAGVISKRAFAPGSVLFVYMKTLRLRGFAHVRHCTQRNGSSFLIGLEFRCPLMHAEAGNWQFQRIPQSGGWTREWEASIDTFYPRGTAT